MYYTERKPKNKKRGGLGTKLVRDYVVSYEVHNSVLLQIDLQCMASSLIVIVITKWLNVAGNCQIL